MKNAISLIACPIFEDELKAELPFDSDITLHLMDSVTHNNPKLIKQELTNVIAEVKILITAIFNKLIIFSYDARIIRLFTL